MASLELKLCENVDEEQICVNETMLFKFSPREIKSNRAIIFFHGGGFVIGNVPYYRHFLSQIGRAENVNEFFCFILGQFDSKQFYSQIKLQIKIALFFHQIISKLLNIPILKVKLPLLNVSNSCLKIPQNFPSIRKK